MPAPRPIANRNSSQASQENPISGEVRTDLKAAAVIATERVLRDTLKKLDAVVNTAIDAIITMNERGIIESVNPAVTNIFGYKPNELIGQNISVLMPDPYRQEHDGYLARYLQTGERRIIGIGREVTGRRRDGSTVPLDLSVCELDLDDHRLFTGFMRDITRRKEAELQLRRLNQTLNERVKERTALLKLMHDVAVRVNQPVSIDELLREVLCRICEEFGWDVGHVYRLDEDRGQLIPTDLWHLRAGKDYTAFQAKTEKAYFPFEGRGLLREVARHGRAKAVTDLRQSTTYRRDPGATTGLRSAMAFPLVAQARCPAVLEFFCERPRKTGRRFLTVASDVGMQLGRLVERKQLQQEYLQAVEEARRLMARELHDGVGGALTGLGMFARGLHQELAKAESVLAGQAKELAEGLTEVHQQLRRVSAGLIAEDINPQDFMTAVASLAQRTARRSATSVEVIGPRTIEPPTALAATHLYCITQEAVSNAVRHGRPSRIRISIETDAHGIIVMIHDNGRGISADIADGIGTGAGLRNMQYRAQVIGASLSVKPSNQGGTIVQCVLKKSPIK
ncbi:MAG: PAS domain S-box protein [Phycisphaeraceae bacterium]|nr:PAS domain S-box protein [Phycisphaeraceae bacterium]